MPISGTDFDVAVARTVSCQVSTVTGAGPGAGAGAVSCSSLLGVLVTLSLPQCLCLGQTLEESSGYGNMGGSDRVVF